MQAQEAALTGESTGVTKGVDSVSETAGIGERSCMVFSGTYALRGSGRAVVIATGDNAEIGRVNAMMMSLNVSKAPLLIQLAKLGKLLAVLAIVLGVLTIIIAVAGSLSALNMIVKEYVVATLVCSTRF